MFPTKNENPQVRNRMNTTWLIVAIILLVVGIALAVWAYFQYRKDTKPRHLTRGGGQVAALPPALTGLSKIFWILAILSIILIIAAIIMMIMAFRRTPSAALSTVAPVAAVSTPRVTTTVPVSTIAMRSPMI